ncbi:uncharacterized protein LOC117314761 isoform X2 [Pecten maximus]|nr:uncharacterized protein LOC117314761 isoform X2 [Pecten maximus]XP_033724758.1 uncharacterized protein LOC117314761 isoform X2 [Pecten maximus]
MQQCHDVLDTDTEYKQKKKQLSLRELWSSEETFPSVHEIGKEKKRKKEKRTKTFDIYTKRRSDHSRSEKTQTFQEKTRDTDIFRGEDKYSDRKDLRIDHFTNKNEFGRSGKSRSEFSRLALQEKKDRMWKNSDDGNFWRNSRNNSTEDERDYLTGNVHISPNIKKQRDEEWLKQLESFNMNFECSKKTSK